MAECLVCDKSSILVSNALNVCLECIRNEPEKASSYREEASRNIKTVNHYEKSRDYK